MILHLYIVLYVYFRVSNYSAAAAYGDLPPQIITPKLLRGIVITPQLLRTMWH